MPAVLNACVNNTVYNFADGSHWSPAGGRQWYLGNLWLNISRHVFSHGKQKEDREAHYDSLPLETVVYSRNVLYDTADRMAVLDGSGAREMNLAQMRELAARLRMPTADVRMRSEAPPVRDAAAHDFRLTADGAAIDSGVKFFVPWGLARTVGEWHFFCNPAHPARVSDEHWYMSIGLDAKDYVEGFLEDWTAGAVRFKGRDQYFVLPQPTAAKASEPTRRTERPADWLEVDAPEKVAPGETFEARVRLLNPPANTQVIAHLHWLKKDGWGGFNVLGQPAQAEVRGNGPYVFRFQSEAWDGLSAWSLLVALTPTGE